MSTNTEIFAPDYIVTPGEILEETLEARGIKKKDFAERCGRTAKMISEIIAGKAAITPETALQFERVLGVSARLWSNLESRYRLKLAERDEAEKLQNHVNLSKDFPIGELTKLGFLEKPSSAAALLNKLLQFFGVGSIDALDNWLEAQQSYYRHSPSFKSEKYSLAAWLRCGQIRAENIQTRPYDQNLFKEHLSKIRLLTKERIEIALPKVIDLCADAGIALVLTPEFKGTKVSGSARWLTKDKAIIQLSARHKSDDHFWFTFFHEAGHILLHGKKDLFIDDDASGGEEKEAEADAFAQNFLVNKNEWKEFIYQWADYPVHIILEFSQKQNIAPGIIVGRLQFQERLLSPAAVKQNALKIRYEWDETLQTIRTKDT